jgi:hypothetical protein
MWDRALSMAKAGDGAPAIAKLFGCSADAVRRKFYRNGFVPRRAVPVRIDQNTYRALRESAAVRQKSVESLLADVVKLLADPVLLENVLDDGVTL